MENSYTVKTNIFEGPLEVLLDLVEKRKLFVGDISLSSVADDYINYVKKLEKRELGDTIGFIIIASTLVLIKSKALLPNISLTEEEEEQISDLEKRLELFSIVQKIIEIIKPIYKERIFIREETKIIEPVFAPDKSITIEEMNSSIKKIISDIPVYERKIPNTEIKAVISIEEMIDSLTKRIEERINGNFSDFAKNSPFESGTKEHKVFVIVGFLSLLELVKNGIADVLQNNNFDEIEFSKKENNDNQTTIEEYQ